ncbi:4'-phosphopantetheinyl transferase superfamily protein [Streptomyces sp. A7024]|uniref:4'-phosphopantetheinyl transferase superfamily protein n=2 Tax=Streptomyces coryli TaxID=1128680 RepID=A0A6G4UBN9_9ACTN|nr:4'-phosphopantetheinyl transferase superfamily protein [Streptomyces coryli]NGN68611.1 4'-phosphopantetheinyl transferase superfamily protein [Streptomyces coryli]
MGAEAGAVRADAGAVSVWEVDLAPDDPRAEAAALRLLDDAEHARVARLTDPRKRAALLRSHAAVRVLLAARTGLPAERIAWSAAANGKPAPVADCAWSLSRSGQRALIALTRGPAVGVDLQAEHPHGEPAALALRFFAPAEVAEVATAPGAHARVRRLCRLLARKEAWAKAAGGRLLHVLPHDSRGPAPKWWDGAEYFIADLKPAPGFAAAVAAAGRPPGPVDHHLCDWRDLCAPN